MEANMLYDLLVSVARGIREFWHGFINHREEYSSYSEYEDDTQRTEEEREKQYWDDRRQNEEDEYRRAAEDQRRSEVEETLREEERERARPGYDPFNEPDDD